MTAWVQAGSGALRSVLTGMRDTPWSWRADDAEDLCRRLGWPLVEVEPGAGVVADAGLGVPGRQVLILFNEGGVDYVKVRASQADRDGGADRDRFIWDTFADAVADGVAVFGEPTLRDHTDPPAVRWRLSDSTVLVVNLGSAVTVTWANNKFQDESDRITEALA